MEEKNGVNLAKLNSQVRMFDMKAYDYAHRIIYAIGKDSYPVGEIAREAISLLKTIAPENNIFAIQILYNDIPLLIGDNCIPEIIDIWYQHLSSIRAMTPTTLSNTQQQIASELKRFNDGMAQFSYDPSISK